MAGNKCDLCGKYELLPFNCKYCGGAYCSAHRLPENHQCSGLRKLREQPRMARPQPTRKPPTVIQKITRPVRLPLSGNYAYILIGITVAVFLLQIGFDNILKFPFTNLLALNFNTLLTRPWGVITSIFLHGSFFHLLFNMLMLFFFGPILERTIGSKNFLLIYFASGIIAGLIQVVIFPGSSVIGASGALFGVLGAMVVLMPNMRIYLYFVPMRLIWAVLLFAALDLWLMGAGDNIAHAAHLTGLLVGVLFGFWYKKKTSLQAVHWHT